jgi:hypothetical protein
MPLASPFLVAALRRHWPVLGALSVLLVLTVVHQLWFQPAAARYQRTLKQANELGMALDPGVMPSILPPRLFALVMDNSVTADEAVSMGNSGTLTAQVLEEVTRMAGVRGMQVVVTEPGPVSQADRSVQVRAHVKVRGRYEQFVGLLEDMARGGKLLAVDRFSLGPDGQGGELLDLWVSRLVLKREKARS